MTPSHFHELDELKKIVAEYSDVARIQEEDFVSNGAHTFPIYSFAFGNTAPNSPAVLFVGGVHGLERVGTQIVLSYLRTVCELARWDKCLQHLLEHVRILFYPLVNPAGMFNSTRSNANGVDLMRNAPISAQNHEVFPLVGGHRLSPILPWYRGKKNAPMETESLALCRYVKRELFEAPVTISLDVHSGFGLKDRLWFPYARTKAPFSKIANVFRLNHLLDETYPNHIYLVEPQSLSYVTHGDLWDFLYEEHSRAFPQNMFLPLSLELGSWMWVKKNPRQLFSFTGAFNPVLPHRMQRAFRRHLVLFDFLLRAVHSAKHWAELSRESEEQFRVEALAHWYGKDGKNQNTLGPVTRAGA